MVEIAWFETQITNIYSFKGPDCCGKKYFYLKQELLKFNFLGIDILIAPLNLIL